MEFCEVQALTRNASSRFSTKPYILWWTKVQDLGSSWIHQRCYRGVMVEEKGKQAEERQDEPRLWRPWRPPRRRMGWRVLWAVGMVVALLTTALLIVHLRPEVWKGLLEERNLTLIATGVSVTAIIVLLAIGGAASSWTGFRGKTVWDLLQLLIVPLALAVIGLWFAAQQDARFGYDPVARVDDEPRDAGP